jgi:hypothetical protein
MFNTLLRFSRPQKTWDGEGAVETMDFANVLQLWGDPVIGEDGPTLVVPAEVDVRRNDIIEVPLNLYLWN